AIRLDRTMTVARVGLARSLVHRDAASAGSNARCALALAPSDAGAAEALASALYVKVDFRNCLDWLNRTLAIAGARLEALLLAATASQALHRVARSARYGRCSAAIVPGAAAIWATLGDTRLMAGDFGQATGLYRRAEMLEPAVPEWGRKRIFAIQ